MLSIAGMKAEIQKNGNRDSRCSDLAGYCSENRKHLYVSDPASYVRSGKKTVYGTVSSPFSAKAELGKARAVAEAVSGPCNRVSWKKVPGASGYYIYRKLQGKSWVRIGTVNNKVLSWQDTKIEGITPTLML